MLVCRRFADDREVAFAADILLHDDAVRASRDRCSGEDSDAAAGFDDALPGPAGERFPDGLQRGREGGEVFGPDGVAIHRRDIQAR